jgi:hypothetical protein
MQPPSYNRNNGTLMRQAKLPAAASDEEPEEAAALLLEEFEVLSIHVLTSLKLLCKSEPVHRLCGRSRW